MAGLSSTKKGLSETEKLSWWGCQDKCYPNKRLKKSCSSPFLFFAFVLILLSDIDDMNTYKENKNV